MNAERHRLEEDHLGHAHWRKWGPYLSDRQWGTVREDYSASGDAWNYFPHAMAASRAYRWGEDGIAGFSDDQQRLCLSVALWNGHDPILKERLFGLTNLEGNHGEDVKELYYHLDGTPTHAYMKMLYKYPQRAYPYARLLDESRRRDRMQPEFELLDTGIFDDDRYFDVFVEYAKASPDDVLMQVTVFNRGPQEAVLHVLPQLWFRNTWTWAGLAEKPSLSVFEDGVFGVRHAKLGIYYAYVDRPARLLFCDNETNPKLWGQTGIHGHFKDAFHDYVLRCDHAAVNPQETGTKAAAYHTFTLPPGGKASCRLRLSNLPVVGPFDDFDQIVQERRHDADEFYGELQAELSDPDARNVQRRRWRACFGTSSSTITTCRYGSRATPPPRRRRPSACTAAISIGVTLTMPKCCRCPINGSTPGTPRGTWHSTVCRWH